MPGSRSSFDLTAIAQGKNFPVCSRMSPRECIINAMLAASAIPVAFPPVFIDKEMYVDGSLRQHGFTINLITGVLHSPTDTRRNLDNPEGFALRLPSTPDPEATGIALTLIANTALEYPLACTGNGIRDIAERSAIISVDQLSIGSFFRLLAETQSHPGSGAKFTYADPALTKCALGQTATESLTGTFNRDYMRCLYRSGCTLAAAGTRLWHTQPTDLPHSPIARRAVSAPDIQPVAESVPPMCTFAE
jgi:patatin-like phospholipase